MTPQKWRTSSGTFSTTEVGDLELTFPEYSKLKRFNFRPDIVQIPEGDIPPIYDVILGVKSLAKIGTVLNFAENTITIDKVELPMRPHDEFLNIKAINAQFRELLEPTAMREATNRAVEILDAKYEKADLALIIAQNCTHLSGHEQEQLLTLLLEFE